MNRRIVSRTKIHADGTVEVTVGARVELVAACCPGAAGTRRGVVAAARRGGFGVAYAVALDDGGEEWVSAIAPAGAAGVGCRFAS